MSPTDIEYECTACSALVSAQDSVCRNCGANLDEDDASGDERMVLDPSLPPYEQVSSRATVVVILLIVCALLKAASFASTYAQIELLSAAQAGSAVSAEAAQANDDRQQSLALLYMFAYLPSLVLFFLWLHAAHRNLRALGAQGTAFTPGWAVGWFFVPFLNLYRPFEVLTETWKASEPDEPPGAGWRDLPWPRIIGLWWGLHIVTGLISMQGAIRLMEPQTADSLLSTSWILLATEGLTIVGAVLTILVIRGVTGRQEARWAAFQPEPGGEAS
jgi:hypothetical protein